MASKIEATPKTESAAAENGKSTAASASSSTPVSSAAPAPSLPAADPLPAAVADSAEANILVPSGTWPPPIYLDHATTAQERYYMEHRWHAQWEWYDKRAAFFKKRHQRIQLVIGVGAGIVPALVAINTNDPIAASWLKFATICLSLIVTTFTVWENVYKHGDMWRSFRSAAEDLAREKALYDMRASHYMRSKSPFMRFVERTEEIIAKQNGQWLNQHMQQEEGEAASKQQRARDKGEEFE